MPLIIQKTCFIFKTKKANKGDKILEIVLSHSNNVQAVAHIFLGVHRHSLDEADVRVTPITVQSVSVDEYTVEVISRIVGSEIMLNVLAPKK